jgi:hypothetical protein
VRAARAHAAQRSDIIELVLADHRRIRRLMDSFKNVVRHGEVSGTARLANVWERAAELLELHIDAEQEFCYLAVFGTGRTGSGR